jgi:hypothetical protein
MSLALAAVAVILFYTSSFAITTDPVIYQGGIVSIGIFSGEPLHQGVRPGSVPPMKVWCNP